MGINMIDTADGYARGNSEKIIGQFIKDRREDVILSTKVGREAFLGDLDANKIGVSRKNIIYRLNQSLIKLQTDYIDLYYIHAYDTDVPLEETMKTMDSLVKAGKVRYIACSNHSAEQIEESREIVEKLGLENYIAVQNQYNLFERDIETSVIPYCVENNVGVLAYSPLFGGLLAGRYEKGKPPPQGSRAFYRQGGWWDKVSSRENFEKLDKIKEVAKKTGLSLPAIAIAWILREKRVTTAVVGASRPEQLEEPAKGADVNLSAEIIGELEVL